MRNASRRESCRAGTACSPGELLAATTAGMVLTPAACSDRSDRDQVSAPPIYLPLRQRRRADVLLVVLRAADRRRRAAHDDLHRLLREELHNFVVIGAGRAASRHRQRVMISVLLRRRWTCCCFRKGSSAMREGLGRSATASPALQRCDGRSFPKVRCAERCRRSQRKPCRKFGRVAAPSLSARDDLSGESMSKVDATCSALGRARIVSSRIET